MKKITSIVILVVLQAVLLYQLRGNFKQEKKKEVYSFELTFPDGRVSQFTKDNFPDDLILYYFTPECKLCFAEVREVVSYSKQQDVNLLFVTSNDLSETRSFAQELKQRGVDINGEQASVARIKEEEVARIFGQIAAPQCVLFGRGLEIKGVRKGVITNRFLAKVFN